MLNERKPEDVMRALECCVVNSNCNGCPFWEGYVTHRNCLRVVIKNALALLREKDAEIKRMYAKIDTLQKQVRQYGAEIGKKDAEIERLQKHNTKMARKHYQDGRAEAIDEFAEETIEWCRKKLKFGKYQTIGLSGKRLEGYEAAMKAVMSYMHNLKGEHK